MSSCFSPHMQLRLYVGDLRCIQPASVAIFTVQQTLLIAVEAYCAELTYSHCGFFCYGRQSGLNGLSSRERKRKAEGVRNSQSCLSSLFHTQLAPIRSLHVMSQASVRPCSRNGRCSTSVAPATREATGQCLTSSTGPGPTRSTTVRGRYLLFITGPLL